MAFCEFAPGKTCIKSSQMCGVCEIAIVALPQNAGKLLVSSGQLKNPKYLSSNDLLEFRCWVKVKRGIHWPSAIPLLIREGKLVNRMVELGLA